MVWRRWGRGPALVLVHGGAGSWLHWVLNIEPLAATRSVWVPDLPGFGDSDLPRDGLDADTLAPMVLAGALELLQGEPFDVAGFSFGALVAALMAAEAPPTLQRLVMVGVAGMGLAPDGLPLKKLRGVTDPAERDAVLRFNLGALMLHDLDRLDDLALEVQSRAAPRERVKNRRQVLTDMLPALAPRWRCAAYGLWGRHDPLHREQLDRLIEKTDRLGLRERVLLDDAGHWIPFERPEVFHRMLQRWLDAPA